MIFYSGNVFAAWKGNALMGGLSGKRIIRISTTGMAATIVQTIPMQNRIRDIAEAPDGSLWIIEDAPAGTVSKLSPVFAP